MNLPFLSLTKKTKATVVRLIEEGSSLDLEDDVCCNLGITTFWRMNMPDPLSTTIALGLATNGIYEIFKYCFCKYNSKRKKASALIIDDKVLDRAAKKYVDRINSRYDAIQVLGRNKPMPLRNIFVKVNLLEKITSQQIYSIEELEKKFDQNHKKLKRSVRTIDGIDVVNEIEKIIILGKPGAGKTTFLKRIALLAIDRKLSHKRIPVFVNLNSWTKSHESLLETIAKEFDICGFEDPVRYVDCILREGQCLLLFDGFDEVGSEYNKAIESIKSFIDKYNSNQIILSCRIAAWNYVFEHFVDVEIADFNDQQIQEFIKNWFDNIDKASICWKKMKENLSIKELASNPLLLTMFCLTFDETMNFPINRAELYKEAIDILLKKWDAARNIQQEDRFFQRQEIYRKLSVRNKESLLCQIAAESFEKNQYFQKKKTLEEMISCYIKNLPCIDGKNIDLDSEAILKGIETQHGVLVERAKNIYSFSHLTIQEYFTSKYVVDNQFRGGLKRLTEQHLFDKRCKEVFLLTSETLVNADDFLILLRKTMCRVVKRKLISFFNDIFNCLKETRKYPFYVCKILSIFLFYTRAFTHVYVRTSNRFPFEYVDNYIQTLIKILAPDIALSHALEIVGDRGRDFFVSIDISLDLGKIDILSRKINPDIFPLLDCYLYVTTLLVECLNADAYVTKETRQKLLDSILVEPWEK